MRCESFSSPGATGPTLGSENPLTLVAELGHWRDGRFWREGEPPTPYTSSLALFNVSSSLKGLNSNPASAATGSSVRMGAAATAVPDLVLAEAVPDVPDGGPAAAEPVPLGVERAEGGAFTSLLGADATRRGAAAEGTTAFIFVLPSEQAVGVKYLDLTDWVWEIGRL